MKSNPKHTAEALVSQLGKLTEQSAPVIGTELKTVLGGLVQDAQQFVTRLEELEGKLNLELDLGHDQLAWAREAWEAIEPGLIPSNHVGFAEVMKYSPTLKALYNTGLTVNDVRKFSPKELDFAVFMGGQFDDIKEPWRKLRIALNGNGNGGIRFNVNSFKFPHTMKLLNVLKTIGFCTGFRIEYRATPNGGYQEVSVEQAREVQSRHGRGFRFAIEGHDTRYNDLVTGTWLNALAYFTLDDHLKRQGVPYEIYTMVRYTANAEYNMTAGDLDVVAMANDTIYLVECKSGKIGQFHKSQMEKQAKELQRCFGADQHGAYAVKHLLLYNPEGNWAANGGNFQPVPELFARSRFTPVTPKNLRVEFSKLVATSMPNHNGEAA